MNPLTGSPQRETVLVANANKIVGYLSGHTCGDACWHARDAICHCSCGGKNHGIFARGEAQPIRTAKINGAMYRLVEVGKHQQIEKRRFAEVIAMKHDWYFDPHGPWLAKPATKSALKNWPELAAFQNDDANYDLGSKTYILWQAIGKGEGSPTG